MGKSKQWESRRERGAYFGLKFTVLLIKYLGRSVSSAIVYIVIAYYFLSSPTARKTSRQYLERISRVPEGKRALGGVITNGTIYRHLVSFGHSILDKFATWQGDISLDVFHQENRDLFDQRIADGKGGVWLVSHLGNMEACQAVFHECREIPVTALVHTKHAEIFNQLIRDINPDNKVELLEVSEFDIKMVLRLQEKISQGEFIFVAGDRTPVSGKDRVVEVPFLGDVAPFPYGPFMIASLLDCPVGSIFCLKNEKGFDLKFHDLQGLEGLNSRTRKKAIEGAVVRFASLLESYCLKYPLQWFNFYDFWGDDELTEDEIIDYV